MLSKVGLQSVGAILALVMSASLWVETAAHAEIFEDYPDAIICRGAKLRAVLYIDHVKDDGSAVYSTLGNAPGTVTPDHVFHREGNKDCDGKTLEQLKQEGKTRELK
jgi:hypothetical protein